MTARWRTCIGIMLFLGVPAAWTEEPADPLEANRQALAKLRGDPAHFERLQEDLRYFLALPPATQQRLRDLDREIADKDPATQERYRRVLRRYADWLDGLGPSERQQVQEAPDTATRLLRIRELLDRQWRQRLPRAQQHLLAQQPDEAIRLKRQEREHRREWQVALRHWDELLRRDPALPARLTDYPPAVRSFVTQALMPLLSKEERDRLRKADEDGRLYPFVLVQLADKHPILAPGRPAPVRFQDLPDDWRLLLSQQRRWPPAWVKLQEGKWPEYAVAVTQFAQKAGIKLPSPLGPTRASDLPPQTRDFVERQLLPRLTAAERKELQDVEGKWPEYPRWLIALARRHDLTIPGMMLPGRAEMWERLRKMNRGPTGGTE